MHLSSGLRSGLSSGLSSSSSSAFSSGLPKEQVVTKMVERIKCILSAKCESENRLLNRLVQDISRLGMELMAVRLDIACTIGGTLALAQPAAGVGCFRHCSALK